MTGRCCAVSVLRDSSYFVKSVSASSNLLDRPRSIKYNSNGGENETGLFHPQIRSGIVCREKL